jgi:hypothetical protein
MTPEQQRIAIAEACGWRQSTAKHSKSGNIVEIWTDGKREWSHTQKIPDYLKDRNAMHEALSTLTPTQGVTLCCHLNEMGITGEWDILTTKLDVLAEAFLRTIGKWVEP